MLKNIYFAPITQLPKSRQSFFKQGLAKLGGKETDDYAAMEQYINQKVDKDNENSKSVSFTVPGWNAPGTWKATPLQVIWDKIFTGDAALCALWYGLLYMQVLIDRDDEWIAIKTNFNREFDQMVYFIPQG